MDESIADTHADESARLPVVILDEGDEDAFSLDDSQISETERAGILHRVFMEIDRTVASVQLSHDIDLICLTGPSCRLEGVEQVFSDHFEIDARRVDLAGPLDADDGDGKRAPSVSLEGGVAVGLALKALGIDHAGFDFRQEELAYRGTFGQLKKALACALTLLFALTFLYAFSLKEELRQEKNYLRGVQTLQENVYTVAFPNLADDSSPYLPLPGGTSDFGYAMQNQFAELQASYGGGGGGDDGPNVSALEVLRQFALCKAKVAARWKVEVIKSSIDPRPSGQSRFVCTTTDQPGAIELTKQFEQNEVVSGFAREVRRDKRTGKWSFEFIVKLRQEEG